ncbi:MAG: hypothetical protein AB2754_09165 [Candidatus Thiodiazotropha endolucinida]
MVVDGRFDPDVFQTQFADRPAGDDAGDGDAALTPLDPYIVVNDDFLQPYLTWDEFA